MTSQRSFCSNRVSSLANDAISKRREEKPEYRHRLKGYSLAGCNSNAFKKKRISGRDSRIYRRSRLGDCQTTTSGPRGDRRQQAHCSAYIRDAADWP